MVMAKRRQAMRFRDMDIKRQGPGHIRMITPAGRNRVVSLDVQGLSRNAPYNCERGADQARAAL